MNVVSPPLPIRGPSFGSRVNSQSGYTVLPSPVSNIASTARFGAPVTPTQVRFDSPSKVTQHQVFTKPFSASVPVYQPTPTTQPLPLNYPRGQVGVQQVVQVGTQQPQPQIHIQIQPQSHAQSPQKESPIKSVAERGIEITESMI